MHYAKHILTEIVKRNDLAAAAAVCVLQNTNRPETLRYPVPRAKTKED